MNELPNELTIPISDGRVVRVPYPLTNEDLEIVVKTLAVWKPQIVMHEPEIEEEHEEEVEEEEGEVEEEEP